MRRVVAIGAGAGFAVLLVHLVELLLTGSDPTFWIPVVDADSYHHMAAAFANGEAMADGPFWQPPFWPALLGGVYWLAGPSVLAGKLFLALLGAGTCGAIALLTARLYDHRTGITAGVLLALYGPFVLFATRLLATGLAVLLFVTALLALLDATERHRSGQSAGWRWLGVGVVTGFAVITVPNTGVVWIATLVWLAARATSTGGWHRALAAAALVSIGLAAVVLPVTARNYLSEPRGQLVAVSYNGGINFYLGNNANADQTLAIRPGAEWKEFAASPAAHGAFSEGDRNRYFASQSLRYLREQPADFLRHLALKGVRLVNAREIPRNIDVYTYRELSPLLGVLVWGAFGFWFPFALCAPLAVFGLVLPPRSESPPIDRQREGRWLVLLCVALYGASVVLFFVSARHRLPFVVGLVPFAAAGATSLARRLRAGDPREPSAQRKRLLAGAAAAVATAVVVSIPVSAPTDQLDFAAEMDMLVGYAHLKARDYGQAEPHLLRALERDPDYAQGHLTLASLYLQRGDRGPAERSLRTVLRLDPDSVHALVGMGQLEASGGRYESAMGWYRRAQALLPGAVFVLQAMARAEFQHAEWLESIGDAATASTHYRRGLELNPQPSLRHLEAAARNLVEAPARVGAECDRAVEVAEQLRAATRDRDPMALAVLARAYERCGRRAQALDIAQRAVEIARDQHQGHLLEELEGELHRLRATPD